MNFDYLILPDLELILESYVGELEYKDIFECKKLEMEHPDWRDHYHVIGDIRKCNITLKDNDIANLNRYFENNQEINARRKSAILTELPSHVVFGTLLKGYNKLDGSLVVPEVFSTIKSALSWLGINQKETERIERMLSQLSIIK